MPGAKRTSPVLQSYRCAGLSPINRYPSIFGAYTTLNEYSKETMWQKWKLKEEEGAAAADKEAVNRIGITHWSHGVSWNIPITGPLSREEPRKRQGSRKWKGKWKSQLMYSSSITHTTNLVITMTNPWISGPIHLWCFCTNAFHSGLFHCKGPKVKWANLVRDTIFILLSWGKILWGWQTFFIDCILDVRHKFAPYPPFGNCRVWPFPCSQILTLKEISPSWVKERETSWRYLYQFLDWLGICNYFSLLLPAAHSFPTYIPITRWQPTEMLCPPTAITYSGLNLEEMRVHLFTSTLFMQFLYRYHLPHLLATTQKLKATWLLLLLLPMPGRHVECKQRYL